MTTRRLAITRIAINTVAIVGLILLFVVLMRLGFWQLNKAEFKEYSMTLRQTAMAKPIYALPQAFDSELQQSQKVVIQGRLDFDKTLLLDNKIVDGKVGYEVLVPLIINELVTPQIAQVEQIERIKSSDVKQWVMVNLGWVAAGSSRQQLPQLTRWPNQKQIVGYLYVPQLNPFIANSEYEQTNFPLVVAQFDRKTIEHIYGRTIYPSMIRLSKDSNFGYHKNWQWVNRMTPEKHRGYAFQWFALAFTLLVLSGVFIWRQVMSGSNQRRSELSGECNEATSE
ncbi:SURF1 family protein [Psychrobium sp. MM17-31]|uniref:SURF1 family protein n=1 Tax=Psychrobium sp. MM17-31 TaxID=2917758 RepID=UPI001EF718B1|nr:SURF1 family protein [Psychrobium sp. MM17-31]MCG7530625.1 SURF1 family protein [Psychrobium sp. MM17-31]